MCRIYYFLYLPAQGIIAIANLTPEGLLASHHEGITAVYGLGQPVFIVILVFNPVSTQFLLNEIPVQVVLIGPLPGLD
jgi:hypothetical protein